MSWSTRIGRAVQLLCEKFIGIEVLGLIDAAGDQKSGYRNLIAIARTNQVLTDLEVFALCEDIVDQDDTRRGGYGRCLVQVSVGR